MKKSVKLLPLMLAAAVSMCGCSEKNTSEVAEESEPVQVSPNSISFEWQAGYDSKIAEFKASEEYSDSSMFDIADITGDGQPELIISPDTSSTCKIYSFSGGAISEYPEIGNGGSFRYLPESHLIWDEYRGESFVLGKIVSTETPDLTPVLTYNDNSAAASTGAKIVHEINGEEVLLTQFTEALQKYETQPSVLVGRKYTFGDVSAEYAVHYAESWGAVLNAQQKQLCSDKLNELLAASAADAFEFCDLNGDDVPELVVSQGIESDCVIYYFYGEELQQLDGSYGSDGIVNYDIASRVFFASVGGNTTYWSISDPNFSAADYVNSGNIMTVGRKYLLNSSNITIALA